MVQRILPYAACSTSDSLPSSAYFLRHKPAVPPPAETLGSTPWEVGTVHLESLDSEKVGGLIPGPV
jgi:hypothetical protein